MIRIRRFLKSKIVLILVVTLFFLGTVFALWETTLRAAVSMVTPVNGIEFLLELYE